LFRLLSWNVNGVRAAAKRGLIEWLLKSQPDVLCLQEVKGHPDDLPPELLAPLGYQSIWCCGGRKGYAGTASYVRVPPVASGGMNLTRFDAEGRLQVLEYPDFTILNGYWPNSREQRARLDYKLDFCRAVTRLSNKLVRDGKNVILCGDFNIAHRPIDLARPKANENNAGYYIEEREAMTRFLRNGYIDTFRHLYPDEVKYSWWSMRTGARVRNVGWRIDYCCISKSLLPRLRDAVILAEVEGSDHCPVGVVLE